MGDDQHCCREVTATKRRQSRRSNFLDWLRLLLVLLLPCGGSSTAAVSATIVHTLPGFSGELPSTLETGYIGVGELEDVQLFYTFVQSQGKPPAQHPLLLWLTGGPGCSGLAALFFESGPLKFNYGYYNGSIPKIHLYEKAWTKGLNVIYVDAPVGTGFSYSTTAQGYNSSDTKSVAQLYQFLGKWLLDHPEFASSSIYIGGESYSGILVPMLVQEILNGIKAGHNPWMNLKGYVLVSPKTDSFIDDNARIPTAYGLTLISKEIYEAAKASCKGDYVNVDSSNVECLLYIETIDELLSEINLLQVLEPSCSTASLESTARFLRQIKSQNLTLPRSKTSTHWCRDYGYVPLGVWANEKAVREALNIRNGTVEFWTKCNSSIEYSNDVTSSLEYHRNLTKTGLRALIFNGDHDLSIPSLATQAWIASLNMTLEDSWRAWSVDGQTAGYTKKYTNGDFSLTYATVKGAGHIAPEYKRGECFNMIDRWFAYYPL